MQKNTKQARQIFHPGITADAEALGVSRQHLFYVLSGKRISKRLLTRYKELKESQASITSKRKASK